MKQQKRLTAVQLLSEHDKKDDSRFELFSAELRKTTELIGQQGMHFSNVVRSIQNIENNHKDYMLKSEDWRKELMAKVGKLEIALEKVDKSTAPLIKQREDQIIVDKKIASLGTMVRNIAAFLVAVGTIISAFVWGFKKLL